MAAEPVNIPESYDPDILPRVIILQCLNAFKHDQTKLCSHFESELLFFICTTAGWRKWPFLYYFLQIAEPQFVLEINVWANFLGNDSYV